MSWCVSEGCDAAAILAQLRDIWSPASSIPRRWVNTIDACHGPWPGVGCALNDKPSVPFPCFIMDSNCSVTSLWVSARSLGYNYPSYIRFQRLMHIFFTIDNACGVFVVPSLVEFAKLEYLVPLNWMFILIHWIRKNAFLADMSLDVCKDRTTHWHEVALWGFRKIPNGNLTGEIPLILAGLSGLQTL